MKKAYLVTLYNIYDATTVVKKVVAYSEQQVYFRERELTTEPGQHIQSVRKYLEVIEAYAEAA